MVLRYLSFYMFGNATFGAFIPYVEPKKNIEFLGKEYSNQPEKSIAGAALGLTLPFKMVYEMITFS